MNTAHKLRAPFTVCMWITDYCNLDCRYCYAMPFSGRRMPTERALELIDEFSRIGVFDITFAGGEPMLHPGIIDLVRRASERRLRLAILTNGVSLPASRIAELEAVTSRQDFLLQVSIDSTDPAVNDKSRGKGKRVLECLERLKHAKLEVQLATVVNRHNHEHAHRVIESYYPYFKHFHFLIVQHTATALRNPDLLMSEADVARFWERLDKYSKGFPPDLSLPSLRINKRMRATWHAAQQATAPQPAASFKCNSCLSGWTHLNVTSDLDVLGCDIAGHESLMGNVADRSFSEVYHSKRGDAVRSMKIPACYKIAGPDGRKLADKLRRQYT